jgi:S-adenosylmethionine-diacylglycerol 3-amino-3-carboxypropyl transferase
MNPPYNFGLSQEDERTEAATLGLPGGRVLCVASAGDMPLSLLGLGAGQVTAVDNHSGQLHLLRLKLGAVQQLEREEAIAFLGYLPAPAATRAEWLKKVFEALPGASRSFWQAHREFALQGAIWAGRYERFIRRAVRLVNPLFGSRFRALLACSSVEEQRRLFARRFDGVLLRGTFRLVFHPRIFSSRGMDPRSLEHRDRSTSLGDQYFEQFRALCTQTAAADNHLLQLHVLGRVLHAGSVPAYLSAAGYERVRRHAADLSVVETDIVAFLRAAPPGSFDGFHLSNVPDWLPQDDFEALMFALADVATTSARVVWRYLHVDRPLPAELQERIRIDTHRGRTLRQADRFPFYAIVPATVGPARPREGVTVERCGAGAAGPTETEPT